MTEEMGGEGPDRSRPSAKPARPITQAYLQRAALHYLERYAAPAAQLRRVLSRRIERRCRELGADPRHFEAMLEAVVATCTRIELVDDRRFAEARATTLRRRGGSRRAIAAKLSAKGVSREIVAEASATSDEEELHAARIAARRKRLGPWCAKDRAERRQKDIAALVRTGFGLSIARMAIDGERDP